MPFLSLLVPRLLQETQKKIEDLKAVCADMRKEISQRIQEKKLLREDLEGNLRQLGKDQKELEAAKQELEQYKVSGVTSHTSQRCIVSQQLYSSRVISLRSFLLCMYIGYVCAVRITCNILLCEAVMF